MTTRSMAAAAMAAVLATAQPQAATGQSDVAFPPDVYAARRGRLVGNLERAPVIVPGADMTRRGDLDRQDPNFWYLTGVESPYAILVMAPSAEGWREILFLPARYQFAGAQYPFDDPRMREAPWNRPIRRLHPGANAERATGISVTYPVDEFAQRLPSLVGDAASVYLVQSGGSGYALPGMAPPPSRRGQWEASLGALLDGAAVRDATPFVERMRIVKDAHEIAALRRAAEISSQGLVAAMEAIAPGKNDREIAGLMEYVWKREGSPRASFGPIVSSGPASVSLYTLTSENYNATDHVMQDGELVFIDYGAAEWQTYASDVCRTFPVSGTFTPRQRYLYEVVLEAQDSALAQIRPGVMMLDVIRAAARVYQRNGFHEFEDVGAMGADEVWGVMPSPTHYLIEGKGLTDYSGARGTGVRDLGHHVGLEASDGRDYTTPLAAGWVFTVEPKLYVPGEDIAIMIEDMILVTESGYENLSASAPRRVAEIERVMARP